MPNPISVGYLHMISTTRGRAIPCWPFSELPTTRFCIPPLSPSHSFAFILLALYYSVLFRLLIRFLPLSFSLSRLFVSIPTTFLHPVLLPLGLTVVSIVGDIVWSILVFCHYLSLSLCFSYNWADRILSGGIVFAYI
ncbi:hypothetical protein I7I48_09434 [Histoplasma ohiense]|nr:hypothetical protein I7I48_09434 [Histoplasma ohiense (nom. inval.)]